MDRSVLLVLLGLQVFLLIASSTSTNTAALVTDPQQLPPSPVGSRNDRNKETFGNRRARYANCRGRPGACGLMGLPGPPTRPRPPVPTRPEEFFQKDGRPERWAW